MVRQLAAAGASVNKALPMDYRTLLRQGQQAQQAQQGAAGGQHAHSTGSSLAHEAQPCPLL